jgi:hypothetical protein
MRALRFRAKLARTRRDWLGVVLPPESAEWLGTRGQAPVEAIVNGAAFRTTAFPSGYGAHVVLVNAALRRTLGVGEGDTLDVELRRAAPRGTPPMPADLRAALRGSEARRAWDVLTPAARRVALTWIEGAVSTDVRSWRVSDVLRRAARYAAGEGPFYPTREDQQLLARPAPRVQASVKPTRSRRQQG